MGDNWEDQADSWDTWGDAPQVQPSDPPKDKKKGGEEDEIVCPVRPEEGDV